MTAIADIDPRGSIIVSAPSADELRHINSIQGARRAYKQGNAWFLPLSPDACDELILQQIPISDALHSYAARMDKTRRYVDHIKAIAHAEPLKPIPIKAPYALFNHQCKAFNIGLALRSAALLMDMGTGKTLSTIMIAGRRFLDGRIHRLLIISPASICNVWRAEFEKFADFPHRVSLILGDHDQRVRALKNLCAPVAKGMPEPLRVAVINYESTWRLKDRTGKVDYLLDYAADMVVLDESQRIKSPSAKQSKAVWKLGEQAAYRIILTGTPIQKDTRDLWSQYRFLDPNVFPIGYAAFQNRYAIMGGFEGRQYLGPRNLEELTRKTHSCGYRVTKEECLDLPEKTFEELPIELDPKSRGLYNALQKQSIAELESCDVTANHVLVRMLRLQQLTGGFLKGDDGKLHQINTAKLDALSDRRNTGWLHPG